MLFSNRNLSHSSFEAPLKRDTDSKLNLQQLESRVDKLELIAEALWLILKRETNIQESDLIELIAEIDLKDGKFDGKKAKATAIRCSKCDRINSKRHTKCLYCGELFLIEPFE